MRYIFDHDLHIHSKLSLCSNDPTETVEAILQYGIKNSLKTLCLTDHYWDESVPGASGWYQRQNYAHIAAALPLPQGENVKFLFGCETDMDKYGTIGVAPEHYSMFDFIIVPTTHLHMNGFTCRGDEDAAERAKLWISRFDTLLSQNMPFEKVGVAHLSCSLMYPNHHEEALRQIPDEEMIRVFHKAAEVGIGIELNFPADYLGTDEEVEAGTKRWHREVGLRPFRIAKEEGCKFYFGSDAHHPSELAAEKANAEAIIDLLNLEESDKYILGR